MLLAFFTTTSTLLFTVKLASTSTHRSFSAKLLSSQSAPSLCWCMELFLPGARAGIFLSWASQGSCQTISPACPGPSEWQQTYLISVAYQPLLTILCCRKTCLSPILQAINEDVKHYWPQRFPSFITSCHYPIYALCTEQAVEIWSCFDSARNDWNWI